MNMRHTDTSNQKETKKSKATIKNQENNQFKRIKL